MANTSNLDLVKPAGTDHALISVINSNMDKVDAYAGKVNTSLAGVEDGLAIVATGNTHAAITAGQFVYVKEHNTLPEGLYTASSNIAANATLSTTNLTADSKGGLNALSDHIVMYKKETLNASSQGSAQTSLSASQYMVVGLSYANGADGGDALKAGAYQGMIWIGGLPASSTGNKINVAYIKIPT